MTANSKQQTANSKQQTAGKILSIVIASALLAACSSSSSGNNIRPGSSSLNEIPEQYRNQVSQDKTMPLVYNENGETYDYTIDGKKGTYNFSDLPNGRTDLSASLSYHNTQNNTTGTVSGTLLVYQQPYSVVSGTLWTQGTGDITELGPLNTFENNEVLGFATPPTAFFALIAQDAIFDYKGVAFDGKEEATLNYTMHFGERKGHGSITGFTHAGTITLQSASLNNDGSIHGNVFLEKDASYSSIEYDLSFFGPNAEELAGDVYDVGDGKGVLGENDIIFAGKR